MWRLDLIVLPLIAVAMVIAAKKMELPQIYRDCARHGAMLAVDPDLRFCVDKDRTEHWLPERR
jgi:hypothetical protein